MKKLLAILLAITFVSCGQNTEEPVETATVTRDTSIHEIKTGGVKMIRVDGKYNVWTKKIGNGDIKVLLLHGGPAFTHDYLECFEDFFPSAGIEFYYYDQLGCGNSDIPTDTSLWNLPRYVEEVEQVRKGLGLDQFYIFGHSWGSLLAMEYLQKYQKNVRAAILSNMTAGVQAYLLYANQLKQKFFSPAVIKTYDSLDHLKKYDSPQYQDLLMKNLYSHVICQLDPWPEPLMRAFKKANFGIYAHMQGVDEFHVTGNLKNWEMWDRLKNIKVPTLVLGGMNDEMNPEDMKREGKLIPNSRTYLCPKGTHFAMYDDQENYFTNLLSFLKDVHDNQFTPDLK